jgi:hypothetical protein
VHAGASPAARTAWVRSLAAFLLVALACLLAACGADRTQLSADTVPPGAPTERHEYPRVGLEIRLPERAITDKRRAPGVFRSSVGQSFVAGFAYRRREQLPRDGKELQAARRRLVGQIRRRDRRFRVILSRAIRVAGARAVEVVGRQRIAHGTFRTRSLHVYKGNGEYVLDMLAPARDFAGVNRTFFSPAVRSLRVTGKVERRGRT